MSAQAGVTSPANTGQRTLKRRNETTWRSEAKAEPHHRVERRSQAHERRMNPDHGGNDVRVERARRVKPQRTRAGGNTRAKKRRRSEANAARNFPVRKHGTRRPVKNHRGEDPGGAKRQESSDRRRRVIPMSAARTAAMRAPTRLRPPVASRLRSGNALGRNNEVRGGQPRGATRYAAGKALETESHGRQQHETRLQGTRRKKASRGCENLRTQRSRS